MESKVSEEDLVSALPKMLDRVRNGESLVIERDGERLAVLSPPPPEPTLGITGSELVARLGDLQMPGDGFADDIEAARAGLCPVSAPPWPD